MKQDFCAAAVNYESRADVATAPRGRQFLTADWLDLAMLNFEVDPDVLRPWLPPGTELDTWRSATYLSVVGFLFHNTRVWGLPIPVHRNFPEVNLRFYVRRRTPAGWRRGVSFIKELAPRWAVATIARWLYRENYAVVPVRHEYVGDGASEAARRRVAYLWKFGGREHQLELATAGEPSLPEPESLDAFIVDQAFGYSSGRGATIEYRVEHPPWRLWPAHAARLDVDVSAIYGPSFVESLTSVPASAFLVDGSRVRLFHGAKIAADC